MQYGLRWERNIHKYEEVKEFIQTHENLGHQVLLPKTNDEFIGVYEQETKMLRLYQISTRRFIRQISLNTDECLFDKKKSYKGAEE